MNNKNKKRGNFMIGAVLFLSSAILLLSLMYKGVVNLARSTSSAVKNSIILSDITTFFYLFNLDIKCAAPEVALWKILENRIEFLSNNKIIIWSFKNGAIYRKEEGVRSNIIASGPDSVKFKALIEGELVKAVILSVTFKEISKEYKINLINGEYVF